MVILRDEYNIQLFVVVQNLLQVVLVEFRSAVEAWILSLEFFQSNIDIHHSLTVVCHDLSDIINRVIHHVLALFLVRVSAESRFAIGIMQILQSLHAEVHQVDS